MAQMSTRGTSLNENQIASLSPASADAKAAAPSQTSIEADDAAGAIDAAPSTTAGTALIPLEPSPMVLPPPPTNEEFIATGFEKVRRLLCRTHEDIVEIGDELIELKERVPPGKWEERLEAELGMSQPTANRFMRVAKKLGRSFPGNAFEKHALYLLAGKEVPDEIIEEMRALAKTKAESGQTVTTAEMKSKLAEQRKTSPRPGGISRSKAKTGPSGNKSKAAKSVFLDFSSVHNLAASVASELTPMAKRLEGHAHKASAMAIAEADGVLAAEMRQLIKQLEAAR